MPERTSGLIVCCWQKLLFWWGSLFVCTYNERVCTYSWFRIILKQADSSSWWDALVVLLRGSCSQCLWAALVSIRRNNIFSFQTENKQTGNTVSSPLFYQPPLVQAIFSGDPEEIRMLIYKTEDVNALVCSLAYVCAWDMQAPCLWTPAMIILIMSLAINT